MELSTADVNMLVETLRRNDFKATEIHSIIAKAWGEEVITGRQVQRIAKEFAEGRRTSFGRKEGSGRKRDPARERYAADIENALRENHKCTVRQLAETFDISHDMVHTIITEDLKWVCKSDKWIPHVLSLDHKDMRVECGQKILTKLTEDRNIMRKLIITDEKWFYQRPIGNSVTRRSWVPPDGYRAEIAKRMTVDKKFMVLMAVTFTGLYNFQILGNGETVNSEVYTNFLKNCINKFSSYDLQVTRQSIDWHTCILMHDNAKPHDSNHTRTFLQTRNCQLLKQPYYSPDYNICDRFIFPLLEMRRSKIHFDDINSLNAYLEVQLSSIQPAILSHEFDMLQIHIQAVIDNNGNYV